MPNSPSKKPSQFLPQGLFVAFEGGEGTGKSTQIRKLENYLSEQGRSVLVTWEPGGTPLGERIREILLDPKTGAMEARCEALLYAAARAEHVAKVIRPALEAGKIVLCDRYWDASRAYQGAARGLGIKAIDRLNAWATADLFPDRVFLFDIPASEGLARARHRNSGKMDRIEQESVNFHEKLRQAYLFLAASDPDRYVTLDSSQGIEEIHQHLVTEIEKLLA